jgi:V/A-type H+-transporting ATPase subunit C
VSGGDLRFAHAAARVRVLELRLVDRGRVERLLEASSVGEALRILAETEYGPAVAALKGGADFEQALASELQRVYSLVESFAPEPRLLNAWAARHAFHNLKALLKAHLLGETPAGTALSPLSRVPVEQLAGMVSAVTGEAGQTGPGEVSIPLPAVPLGPPQVRVGGAVGERVSGPASAPYLIRAAEAAVADYRAHEGPEELDQAVDRVYQEYLVALAGSSGTAFLRGWVARWADLTNLRTFLRFALAGREATSLRRALLDGGLMGLDHLERAYRGASGPAERLKTVLTLPEAAPYRQVVEEGLRLFEAEGLLHGFERASEAFLLEYLRQAKHETTGFAPVWAYLMAKEQEVRLLRLILVGKSAGVSPAELRERVSDVYA